MKKSVNTTKSISNDQLTDALINNDNYKLNSERVSTSSIYFWPTVTIGKNIFNLKKIKN